MSNKPPPAVPPDLCHWTEPGTDSPVHEGELYWLVIGCTHEHVQEGWSCRRHLDRARLIAASEQVPCGCCGHACGLMILVAETREVIRT